MFWRGYTGTAMEGHPMTTSWDTERPIVRAGDNIFAVLAFPAEEAQQLFADAQRRIQQEIALRSTLGAAIASWMTECGLTEVEAARRLGVDSEGFSKLARRDLYDFSVSDLFGLVVRTGLPVSVSLG